MTSQTPSHGSGPPPRSSRPPRWPLSKLSPSDAAIYETFVVPKYMTLFGDVLLEMLVEGNDAQVVHLSCRTGYPDRAVVAKLPGAHLYGIDPSGHAIELARAKAQTMPGMIADYRVADTFPAPLPDGAFSHGYSLHPVAAPEERKRLLAELARLVAPQGQVLVAMPTRGTFLEIADLLREYALKNEADDVARAVEAAVLLRPSADDLAGELRAAGFDFVEVEQKVSTIDFPSGRAFFEDPVTRLMVLPDFGVHLDHAAALGYVRKAIDRYWSEISFGLTVSVGCVSGRRA